MIASLSFQLSWGCFISLPILTTFVYGIQVVLQAEVDTFSVRTVSSSTGQCHLLIISYYLKTSLSCPTFTTGMAKAMYSNATHFHVEITLCKLSTYTSPLHSRMAEYRYINAALASLQAHSHTDARDQFHYKFFVYNTPSLSAASSPKGSSSAT